MTGQKSRNRICSDGTDKQKYFFLDQHGKSQVNPADAGVRHGDEDQTGMCFLQGRVFRYGAGMGLPWKTFLHTDVPQFVRLYGSPDDAMQYQLTVCGSLLSAC